MPADIVAWPLDRQLRWWAEAFNGIYQGAQVMAPLVQALEEAATEIEMGRRHVGRVAQLRGEPDTRRIAPE